MSKISPFTLLKVCFLMLFVLVGKESVATTYYVKIGGSDAAAGTDWATAFATVQKALTTATSGDQIWVAKGTYYPTADASGNLSPVDARTKTFVMKTGVYIYGGFVGNEAFDYDLSLRNFVTNETTLSGDIDHATAPLAVTGSGSTLSITGNSGNSLHVVFNNGNGLSTTNSLLDGFTITGGNANRNYPDNLGGGMYNSGSSPKIVNCSFLGNQATGSTSSTNDSYGGGGMSNISYSSPSLTNCSFSNNKTTLGGGGGICTEFGISLILTNCSFSGNQARNGGGMYNSSNDAPGLTTSLTNCSFSDNHASYLGGGMYNYFSSPKVTNCTFTGNSAVVTGGGMYQIFSSPALVNCSLSGNQASYAGGISSHESRSSLYIYNCILWGNGSEEANFSSGNPTYTKTLVKGLNLGSGVFDGTQDPLFVNAAGGDLRLQACSPVLNAGNDGDNSTTTDLAGNSRKFGTIDLGAYEYQGNPVTGIRLYVNASAPANGDGTTWATAFKTLQEALQLSCPSVTQIWIAKGTYYPDEGGSFANNDRNAAFVMKSGVSIYGGFVGNEASDYDLSQRNFVTNETTLSGDLDQNDGANFANNGGNAYHVIYNNGNELHNNTVLDGFTVKAGNANGNANNGFPNGLGGGMFNYGSSPTVSNCLFTNNAAFRGGAGLSAYYNAAWLRLPPPLDNIKISKCIFSNNTASGTFSVGGGMYTFQNQAIIENTAFSQNSSTYGGGLYASDCTNEGARLSNVVFSENTANTLGGGIASTGSNVTVINGTFSNNSVSNPVNAATAGGGIYFSLDLAGTRLRLLNCIFWGNTGAGNISSLGGSSGFATNCNIQGFSGGSQVNCIDQNPLFINAADPDGADNRWMTADDGLQLQACSPSLNAGVSSATVGLAVLNAPANDILGNARVGTTDMGAYEYQGTPLTAPSISGGGTVCQFGASPLINFTGFGGTRPYTFTYSVNNGPNQTISSTAASSVATLSPATGTAGNFTFTLLQVTDANGCQVSLNASNTANVSITSNPAVTASSNAPVCVGSQLNLSVSGGTGWTWSGPNGFSNNAQNPSRPSATTAMSGVYSVTVSTANGCTQVATTQVTIGQLTTPQISSNSPLCVGGTLRLSVTGAGAGVSYSWGATVPFSSTLQNPSRPSATVAMSGTYSVTITGGCSLAILTTSVVVSPNVAPSITSLRVNGTLPNAQNTVAVCNNAPVTLTVAATNTVTYSWRGPTGAGSGFTSSLASPVDMPISTPRQGQYTVTVRNGCQVFNQRVINIQLSNCATRLASAEDAEALEMEINAYPNPVSKTLTVEVRLKEAQPLQLQLLNSVGQQSGSWQLGEASTLHRTELDLSKLTGGVYLLEAQAGKQRAVKRVVKIQYQ